MKIKLKIALLLLFTFIFIGCDKESTIKNAIIGDFSIIFINHNDVDLLYSLSINIIEFHKDGSVKLPCIVDRQKQGLKENRCTSGIWNLHKKNKKFFIDIITQNEYFNGSYEVSFDKNNEKKLLQIVLMNDIFGLAGEKFFLNYDKNEKLINDLIKYTDYSTPSTTKAQ